MREMATSSPTSGQGEAATVHERAVRQALALLADGQREVILLHAYEGMTFAEIAQVLRTTGVAARVRAHRAYRKLRELLGPLGEEQ